jgi:hypothetical protein
LLSAGIGIKSLQKEETGRKKDDSLWVYAIGVKSRRIAGLLLVDTRLLSHKEGLSACEGIVRKKVCCTALGMLERGMSRFSGMNFKGLCYNH